MSLNHKEIKILANELKDRVKGGIINKITQIGFDEFYIQFRNFKSSIPITIKISNKFCFIGEGKKLGDTPKNTYAFTQICRKYLKSEKVIDIKTIENDRVIEIIFCNYTIILELLGRNGNIFLIENESQLIKGTLFNKNGEKRIELPNHKYERFPSHGSNKEYTIRNEIVGDQNYLKNTYNYYYKKIKEFLLSKETKNLKKDLKKSEKFLIKLEKEYNNAKNSDKYIKYGNLILANNHNLKNKYSSHEKVKEITLLDYENNEEIKIPIKPNLSFVENANKFFRRSKQLKKRESEIQQLLEAAQKKTDKIRKKINYIQEHFDFRKNYTEFYSKQTNTKQEKTIIHNFTLSSGKKAVVGKNAKNNLLILRKYANGSDYWFHTRDFPGSYVIVKNSKLNIDDIKEASMIAIYYSKARNASKADVIYTQVKHVKPIKNSPGKVIFTNDKNFYTEIDDILINKLRS